MIEIKFLQKNIPSIDRHLKMKDAARMLGISKTTLWLSLKREGLMFSSLADNPNAMARFFKLRMLKTKPCKNCKKEFDASSYGTRTKSFCSLSCRRMYRWRNPTPSIKKIKEKRFIKSVMEAKTGRCLYCGVEFSYNRKKIKRVCSRVCSKGFWNGIGEIREKLFGRRPDRRKKSAGICPGKPKSLACVLFNANYRP